MYYFLNLISTRRRRPYGRTGIEHCTIDLYTPVFATTVPSGFNFEEQLYFFFFINFWLLTTSTWFLVLTYILIETRVDGAVAYIC